MPAGIEGLCTSEVSEETALMRWTADDVKRYQDRQGVAIVPATSERKPSKYRNVRTLYDGEAYDSKLEARCAQWLHARWQTGEVAWFIRQVSFLLEGGVRYRADFLAVLTAGGVDVIDAKGRDTRESINKRKQVKARYGVEVKIWTGKAYLESCAKS